MRDLTISQQEAIEKLARLKVGALFMACGTGKTQTATALVNSIEDVDLLLWICPCRTKENVRKELDKCGLRYNPYIVGVESIGQSGRIYLEVYEKVAASKRCVIVMDESLKIKNGRAIRSQRIMNISRMAEYKLILNGTPVTKNICDLYSQMNFLSPKIFNCSFFKFRDRYCTYTQYKRGGRPYKTVITGYANVDHLLSVIAPYVYQCQLNLPLSKKYSEVKCYCSLVEEYAYQSLKEELLMSYVDSYGELNMLAIMSRLQHSYCLFQDKLDKLADLEPDEKTIIYCKFIVSRDKVQSLYPQSKVLTYGTGSIGLNLQAFNRIIYFDKTFDYAFREQSEARIYRQGQQDDCRYVDMTLNIGLEDIIDECIAKKTGLVEYIKEHGKEKIKEMLDVKKIKKKYLTQ